MSERRAAPTVGQVVLGRRLQELREAAGLSREEAARVLRRDGQLVFAEHGRAPDARVRAWQDRLTPAWSHLAGGCHLNRSIAALIASAGFEVTALQEGYGEGPRPLSYLYRGSATPIR